jgi:iron complex outermembrane receptor protein
MHNRLTYELTCFNAVFSNKMTAISVVSPASPTTTLYSYVVNGGKQLHNGVEALVKYTVYQSEKGFFSSIRPFANLTYSDFKYGDHFTIQKSVTATEDYSKKAVAGVAKMVANLGMDINTAPGMYANISYNYKDKMPITSLNDTYAASYNLLNGKIGLKRSIGKHIGFDAFLGVNNATGTKYYLMAFVNQLPDAYIPAPTRATVFGGVNLQYNF